MCKRISQRRCAHAALSLLCVRQSDDDSDDEDDAAFEKYKADRIAFVQNSLPRFGVHTRVSKIEFANLVKSTHELCYVVCHLYQNVSSRERGKTGNIGVKPERRENRSRLCFALTPRSVSACSVFLPDRVWRAALVSIFPSRPWPLSSLTFDSVVSAARRPYLATATPVCLLCSSTGAVSLSHPLCAAQRCFRSISQMSMWRAYCKRKAFSQCPQD